MDGQIEKEESAENRYADEFEARKSKAVKT
jgi:hypothetical protein